MKHGAITLDRQYYDYRLGAGQGAVRALAEPHPAVAQEKGIVLHSLGGDDLRPEREGCGGTIVM